MDTSGVEAWLCRELAAALDVGVERIDVRTRFKQLGLDSAHATAIIARLGQRLQRPLPVTLFWEYATVEAVARHLVSPTAADHGAAGEEPIPLARARNAEEPIAIVGASCRFAGGVRSLESFWQLLERGGDAISDVPADRWNVDAFFDADRTTPGKMNTRRGGFVDGVDRFDAEFFGISPREAMQMDPQQRLLLELAWEALEDAATLPEALQSSATGVFVGVMGSDYARMFGTEPERIEQHTATGHDTSIIAARVAYTFGLQGPAMSINTACSSSLVAVHLACQSLRDGESEVALAGGVHLVLSPLSTIAMTKFGALSTDGRCKAFDLRADGYVRGEGGGLVVLKRLSRAIADRDRIRGVVLASAVNNDGFSNGLTAPNPKAQEQMLRTAYARARIAPRKVAYVETHGPGTLLGDPIEAGALGKVLGAGRRADRPLRIGSVKTNLGHTEAAAGIAGLLKVLLALEHDRLPPNLHFETANPHIDFESLRLEVQSTLEPWPSMDDADSKDSDSGDPRIAGVSSFGFGGTNCHLVVRGYPAPRRPADVWREARPPVPSVPPRIVFVCPGQGGQWSGMGVALLREEAVFRFALEACDRAIRAHTGWSVLERLTGTTGLGRTDVVQPVLFAMQVAMARLWESWGIRPDALVGFSQGEMAAAHLAGILSLEDAARIVCVRSALLYDKAPPGGMLSVALPAGDALRAAGEDGLVVAAHSGPAATVLSGEVSAIERALLRLDADGLRAARIDVDYASHSPAMKALEGELSARLAGLTPCPATVRMVSTVLGGEDLAGSECGPRYWVRNLQEPVRFQQAVERLGSEGPALFVELGPHPVLVRSIQAMIAAGSVSGAAVASCHRDEEERESLLASLDTLVAHGAQLRVEPSPVRGMLFPISGKTEAALRAQAALLRDHVAGHADRALEDLAFSLATTRTHFEHRASFVANERAQLLDALDALAEGRPFPRAAVGRSAAGSKVVFVFPGQGSQWPGMAVELLRTSPLFRQHLEACERALAPHIDWSLLAVLRGEDGAPSLDRVDVVQPALFAVMVSLAALWRSLGVEPDAVVGHSQGEIAAAHVAGALSLEDAAKIVAWRSRALRRLAGAGAMASVESSVAELRSNLAPFGDRLAVAAINGPTATLVSGDSDAVDAFLENLESGVFARKVQVDYASHSAHVEAVREDIVSGLATITPRRCAIPLRSTVTATSLEGPELDAEYWFQNLRRTVRFADVTESLRREGFRYFVEVSPHPVLTLAMQSPREHAGDSEPVVVGTLRRHEGDFGRILLAAGELHTRGLPLDWTRLVPSGRRTDLPTYAFQRQRHWLDASSVSKTSADVASAGLATMDHPLLGAAVPLPEGQGVVFTGRLSLAEQPWLAGHQVFGEVILPGAAFVELALAAAHRVGLDRIEELTLESPIALPPHGATWVQLALGPVNDRKRSLTVHTRAADSADLVSDEHIPWTRHATGTLAPASASVDGGLRTWPPRDATPVSLDGVYERLARSGLSYGPDFQGLRAMWRRNDELFAEVALPHDAAKDAPRFAIHPALLDAALHALAVESVERTGDVVLPFTWSDVSLRSVGASLARVSFRYREERSTVSMVLADAAGDPLARIDALTCRPVSAEKFHSRASSHDQALLRVDWSEVTPAASVANAGANWALLGDGTPYPSLADLQVALEQGVASPDVLVARFTEHTEGDLPAAAHRATARALALLQTWLADERFASTRLAVITRRAMATHGDEDVEDLAHAPLWGLVRSAQTENPDRHLYAIDIDDSDASRDALRDSLASSDDERQFALRDGRRLVPRLSRPRPTDSLRPPEVPAWRLHIPTKGSIEDLTLIASPEATAPLARGQVRLAVHAAGLNFRDVLDTLGMYPDDPGPLGTEAAGVVTEVGPDVTALAVGDRVMGVVSAAFGPMAVADARTLIRMPAGWSFAQAASVPVIFLTAYYALVDLARLAPGERILVHAAAGGVGMAATQLARHLGAEVFATASPGKWTTLRTLGFDDPHMASSRTLEFEHQFRISTQGAGFDVVLDSLAHAFVDASLRLLPRGGRFIEMGKTDIRDPNRIAEEHPGVVYRAFDLLEAGPDRIQQMLAELGALFDRGVLRPPPITCWDVRRAPEAFRTLARAAHVGKCVLTVPQRLDPKGTVLMTGGTGTLGALVAQHLVKTHGAKHLLLVSRQGASAPGARDLQLELEAAGARVTLAACDVADREALRALLDGMGAEHPLTAVVHAAGTLDDGVLDAMTEERMGAVFAPKLDAAAHLHELTKDRDLAAFVLFSSLAGVLGNPGQSNYAAANAFLDALAHHRTARGLAATSLAWGYWSERSGLTRHLGAADLSRLRRGGFRPLSSRDGLALFDAALLRPESALVLATPDPAALAASATPMTRKLARGAAMRRAATNTSTLQQGLPSLAPKGRERAMLDLVCTEVATALGLPSAAAVQTDRALRELGLDSLLAVEVRNRLAAASGLRLQSNLLFDYPTANALAGFLSSRIDGSRPAEQPPRMHDDEVRPAIPSKAVEAMNASELIKLVLNQSSSDDA
ncbi:SDR family NAD(P)-dependent oxidoreductase [Pendulispora rubella]|uniref:SDR family NAD(P)-dependent oxidoreductase n=1 Tax=Pendulispora rubella TaxID=2741070 RepID=A0ABZ2LFT6_9BACT